MSSASARHRKAESVPPNPPVYTGSNRGISGRSASHYVKTFLFYILFYIVLIALTAICLWVFFKTIDPKIPKWQLDQSLIGTNPGLNLRPVSAEDLIWYNASRIESYSTLVNSLESLITKYEVPGLDPVLGQNIYDCDYDHKPVEGKVCDVNAKNWHPCTRENNFNFHKSAPCIFFKLNKIYGWVPEYFNYTDVLPPIMPPDLKQYIAQLKSNPKLLNTVWLTCQGKTQEDEENIGPIQYFPTRGFPGYYYPFTNIDGYLSPLVAVHLERPKTGVLINIECKAWARNIRHDRRNRLGSVLFKLLID